MAVAAAAVEPVLVAALETLAEVVGVVGAADVAAGETVAGVDPHPRTVIVVAPVTVGQSGAHAFLVTALDRTTQHGCAVVAGVVPAAAVVVAVAVGGRIVGVMAGVGVGPPLGGLAGPLGVQPLLVGTLAGLLPGNAGTRVLAIVAALLADFAAVLATILAH